jgi:1,4-dihydroxy-2-naphthoate polyprenyltransferase
MKRSPVRSLLYLIVTGRPHFLPGGVVVYALGTAVAWHEMRRINMPVFALGLAVLLLIQLMTHYFNEYWDREDDARITRRTVFSGGSGVLAAGLLSEQLVYRAGVACALAAVMLTIVLAADHHLSWGALLVIALGMTGGIAYSQPPLRLVTRGLGELSAAFIVSFLGPALAYLLQTGRLSSLLIVSCLPASLMMLAMLMSVEFPDYAADVATAKRNLVVRLGIVRAANLNNVALLGVYVVSAGATFMHLPVLVAALPFLELPAAALQIKLVRDIARGDDTQASWLTFLGGSLFFVFCGLQVAGYMAQ